MDDKYYILINSDQLGPYSATDLSGLLSDGVITRLTPLKSDDRDSWFTVGDVLPESPSQSSSLGSLPAHAPKPPAPAPPAVPKPMPSPESLMVHVSRDGQQFGPYKYSELQGYLMTGELHPNDMAWHEGLAEWVDLRSLVNSKTKTNPASSTSVTVGQTKVTSGIPATVKRYTVNKANRLYSVNQIVIAAFFGGPVAGCWCLSVNYRLLGDSDGALKWLVYAGVSFVALALLSLAPIPGLNILISIPLLFFFNEYAKRTQGAALAEHTAAGGRLPSTLVVVFGVSAVVYLLVWAAFFLLEVAFPTP